MVALARSLARGGDFFPHRRHHRHRRHGAPCPGQPSSVLSTPRPRPRPLLPGCFQGRLWSSVAALLCGAPAGLIRVLGSDAVGSDRRLLCHHGATQRGTKREKAPCLSPPLSLSLTHPSSSSCSCSPPHPLSLSSVSANASPSAPVMLGLVCRASVRCRELDVPSGS